MTGERTLVVKVIGGCSPSMDSWSAVTSRRACPGSWTSRSAVRTRPSTRSAVGLPQGARHRERLRAAARRRRVPARRPRPRTWSGPCATGGPGSAPTACCGWSAPRRTTTRPPSRPAARPSGSWTTATATAPSRRCAATGSGCSPATSPTTRASTCTRPLAVGTRAGVKVLTFGADGLVVGRHGRAGRARRDEGVGRRPVLDRRSTSRWATRTPSRSSTTWPTRAPARGARSTTRGSTPTASTSSSSSDAATGTSRCGCTSAARGRPGPAAPAPAR